MKEELQQALQQLMMQKQQFQSSMLEVDSALEELGNTEESYKLVGNLLLKMPADKLKAELEEKKKMLQLRIESIEKQEEKIKND